MENNIRKGREKHSMLRGNALHLSFHLAVSRSLFLPLWLKFFIYNLQPIIYHHFTLLFISIFTFAFQASTDEGLFCLTEILGRLLKKPAA